MTEWDEQKTGIADDCEDRATQYREQNSATPSDTIEIANAGSHHDGQKCKP
jgi:hypothetical protein